VKSRIYVRFLTATGGLPEAMSSLATLESTQGPNRFVATSVREGLPDLITWPFT